MEGGREERWDGVIGRGRNGGTRSQGKGGEGRTGIRVGRERKREGGHQGRQGVGRRDGVRMVKFADANEADGRER